MPATIDYRPPRPGEERGISELLVKTFDEFVGHEYESEGVEEFLRLAVPETLAERWGSGPVVLIAVERQPIGVIELRRPGHLVLLFVAREAHRRGVASELVRRGIEILRRDHPALDRVTVNSSRYAVGFYEAMGFEPDGGEKVEDGMVLVPMALPL